MTPRRFDVHLVGFGPATGAEIKKVRPSIVVSPDEANRHLWTVVVVPLTSTLRGYPTRVRLRFQGRDGEAALDQLRSVDKARLGRRLGSVGPEVQRRLVAALKEFFA